MVELSVENKSVGLRVMQCHVDEGQPEGEETEVEQFYPHDAGGLKDGVSVFAISRSVLGERFQAYRRFGLAVTIKRLMNSSTASNRLSPATHLPP